MTNRGPWSLRCINRKQSSTVIWNEFVAVRRIRIHNNCFKPEVQHVERQLSGSPPSRYLSICSIHERLLSQYWEFLQTNQSKSFTHRSFKNLLTHCGINPMKWTGYIGILHILVSQVSSLFKSSFSFELCKWTTLSSTAELRNIIHWDCDHEISAARLCVSAASANTRAAAAQQVRDLGRERIYLL